MPSKNAATAPFEFAFSAIGTFCRGAIPLALCLALLLDSVNPGRLAGQQPEFIDREPEIKAAYLYNFGRYVEWPAGVIGPREFVIGVIGESPVITPLGIIAESKQVNGKAITVRRIRVEKDFKQCHLLFVPAGQDPKFVAAILKAASDTPTLIVGEQPDFALKQGHVGFYTAQNNVKFEINNQSAVKAGLKISAKLLSLGRIVGEKPGK